MAHWTFPNVAKYGTSVAEQTHTEASPAAKSYRGYRSKFFPARSVMRGSDHARFVCSYWCTTFSCAETRSMVLASAREAEREASTRARTDRPHVEGTPETEEVATFGQRSVFDNRRRWPWPPKSCFTRQTTSDGCLSTSNRRRRRSSSKPHADGRVRIRNISSESVN